MDAALQTPNPTGYRLVLSVAALGDTAEIRQVPVTLTPEEFNDEAFVATRLKAAHQRLMSDMNRSGQPKG